MPSSQGRPTGSGAPSPTEPLLRASGGSYGSLNDFMEGPDGGAIFANGGDWRRFGFSLVTFEILMVVLFMNFVEYEQAAFDDAQVIQYSYFLDVSIMMLVGFGFLMTFMRKYGLGAVGLTFMVTTCCIPWCILTGRFFATLAGSTADYPNSVRNRFLKNNVISKEIAAGVDFRGRPDVYSRR